MPQHPILRVKPSRQLPFLSRHPWVHTASLIRPEQTGADDQGLGCGTVVDLATHDGQWIATGLYNPASSLRVRLYSWAPGQTIDIDFFRSRIDAAIARRRAIIDADPMSAYRIVYSEADGISGLIVDRYADTLSVQVTAAAIEPFLPGLLDHLEATFKPKAIVLRTDPKLQTSENFQSTSGVVRGDVGETGSVVFHQNQLEIEVDLLRGQKTGAYLDQRDNHSAAARHCIDRSVLDVCCHTGGFGLLAAKRGAKQVLGVDSSQGALAAASRNAERNNVTNIEFQAGDCFDTLKAMVDEGRKFDAVVLDPPRMAGSRKHVESALRAYYRLNRSAVDLLKPGGILVTCSCSGRITRADFLNNLVNVGRRSGRDITVMENRGAAPDHPMRVSCPESDYLKCLICEIQ